MSDSEKKQNIFIEVWTPTNGLEWCAAILDRPQPSGYYGYCYSFFGTRINAYVYTNEAFTREDCLYIATKIIHRDGVIEWNIPLND